MFQVTEAVLSVDAAMAAVAHPGAGGIAVFVGVVRAENEGRPVLRLEYEAYGTMALREMEAVGREVTAAVPGARVAALHRVGTLQVGELAVVCAASAAHRAEAFRACRSLIDGIKARVPVWKREWGPGGAHWVNWQDARCGHDPGDGGA